MLDKDVKISCGAADGSPPDEWFHQMIRDDLRDHDTRLDIDRASMRRFITEEYGAEIAQCIYPNESLTEVRPFDDTHSL